MKRSPLKHQPIKHVSMVLGVAFAFTMAAPLRAQIVAVPGDAGTVVTPSGSTFTITGGTAAGANLFHSFQRFGLTTGQIANFISNPAIQNILGRVTGGEASVINGLLRVTGGNSNLYLMNPAGIVFGANARLDVSGSFMATTANGIGFGCGTVGCGGWFGATGLNDYARLTGNPGALAFTMPQPGAIANTGNLAVRAGQTLSLVGGTVVSTGTLTALDGQVILASVPGSNLVRLSQAGSLLSLEFIPLSTRPTPPISPLPPALTYTPPSLAQLLTGGNLGNATGLTVNGDGTVSLTGSGIPVERGDVVARTVTAATATFLAANNLTLIESQLRTTGDLNLLAQNTVRVRDSATRPAIAQAGGKLTVQGNRAIDVFILNNPASGLVSGGDMVLRSATTIRGDAHYITGGNLRFEQLNGSAGNVFSPYDPIILARGDVTLAGYTGASLHILAGGSVTIAGDVNITGAGVAADTINPANTASYNGNLANTFASLAPITRADGTRLFVNPTPTVDAAGNVQRIPVDANQLVIDGRNPTLDIRAGIDWSRLGGLPGDVAIGIAAPVAIPATSANITINSIRVLGDPVAPGQPGTILLTNQYFPNPALAGGTIQVTGTVPAFAPTSSLVCLGCSSPSGGLGAVVVDSRADVQLGSLTTQANSVNVNLTAVGNIVAGDIKAAEFIDSEGNAGSPTSVSLRSTAGNIRVRTIRGGANGIDVNAAGLFQATGVLSAGFVDGQRTPSTAGTPVGNFLLSKGISPPPAETRVFFDPSFQDNVSILTRPRDFPTDPANKAIAPVTIQYGDGSRLLINDSFIFAGRPVPIVVRGGAPAFYLGPQGTGPLVPNGEPFVMRVGGTYTTVTPANFSAFTGFTRNESFVPLVFGSAAFPADASGLVGGIAIGTGGDASLYGSTQNRAFPAIIRGGGGSGGLETGAGEVDGQNVQRQLTSQVQGSACSPSGTVASNPFPNDNTRTVSAPGIATTNPCAPVTEDAQILKILEEPARDR